MSSLLLHNFQIVTFDSNRDDEWGIIPDGAVFVEDGLIKFVGSASDVQSTASDETIDGAGRLLTPGLIDCHTHLVYAGSRADEWQMRLKGTSYEEIARAGGGILSTVKATRNASAQTLMELALRRIEPFLEQGVTTFEIKSGYGLDLETELKMLGVAQRLGELMPVDVHPTLLGAHAVPPEFKGQPDAYLDVVVNEMIPAAKGVATAVDVFTENIAFDLKQTERVFQAAKDHGFEIKIHAEQLSNLQGAKLAAEMEALSADHLEYLDESSVEAMAHSGTVATLLPGAFYFLKETQSPPVALLRKHGVSDRARQRCEPGKFASGFDSADGQHGMHFLWADALRGDAGSDNQCCKGFRGE